MLVFKGEKIHRRICSYRYIYLVKILVFPVRSGGGGRQILSRSLLGEEKRSDTVVAGHRLLRGHGNLSQNRALLERDTGLVWIHRTCSLGFHRISAFLAHSGAGFQPQSRQDSAHQTFRMGHRRRPLSNRRHVLPGKQDLIHRRNSPLCLDIDSTKKKFFNFHDVIISRGKYSSPFFVFRQWTIWSRSWNKRISRAQLPSRSRRTITRNSCKLWK